MTLLKKTYHRSNTEHGNYLLFTSGCAEFKLNLGFFDGDLQANLFLGDLMWFSLSVSVTSFTSTLTSGWALERELKNLGLREGPGWGRGRSSSSSD